MIQTQAEVDRQKKNEFYRMLSLLGGSVVFKKPILFRETPHMPTVVIRKVNDKDDFDSYGLARDTILQVLRGLTFNLKNNESN